MIFSKSCFFVLFFCYSLSATAVATATVNIGTAGNYAILAKTGISTVPTSSIVGDIAVSPIAAGAITGFGLTSSGTASTSTQVTGMVYAANYDAPTPSILTIAVGDMEIAYTDAAGRVNLDTSRINIGDGEIGGLTLEKTGDNGVYTFGSGVSITSDVTFSGGPDDIFIIQLTGNLIAAAGTKVLLQGGVQAKNIFWQIAGNGQIMANAHMEGIFLVKTDILFVTGSTLNGRVLTQTACNLQMATITQP